MVECHRLSRNRQSNKRFSFMDSSFLNKGLVDKCVIQSCEPPFETYLSRWIYKGHGTYARDQGRHKCRNWEAITAESNAEIRQTLTNGLRRIHCRDPAYINTWIKKRLLQRFSRHQGFRRDYCKYYTNINIEITQTMEGKRQAHIEMK